MRNAILRQKILASISLSIGLLLSNGSLFALAEPPISQRIGLPGRRFSDGTRCGCIDLPMVALMPRTNLGETISAEPSVHMLIAPMNAPHQGEFFLYDGEGAFLYTASQTINAAGGTISFRLPPNVLNIDESYRWDFSILANDNSNEIDSDVAGWIRRVESEAITSVQIDATQEHSLETRLALLNDYQAVELWTDAVSLIVDLRQQYPNESSVQEAWVQLLQTLDLTKDNRLFGENWQNLI